MSELSCGAIRNIPRVRAAILRQSTEALDSSLMSQIGGMIRRDFHILKALALRKLKNIFPKSIADLIFRTSVDSVSVTTARDFTRNSVDV